MQNESGGTKSSLDIISTVTLVGYHMVPPIRGCWVLASRPCDLTLHVFNIAHAAISSAHTYMSLIIYALKVRQHVGQQNKRQAVRFTRAGVKLRTSSPKQKKLRREESTRVFHESGYHCKKIGTSCVRWTDRRPWAVGRRVFDEAGPLRSSSNAVLYHLT